MNFFISPREYVSNDRYLNLVKKITVQALQGFFGTGHLTLVQSFTKNWGNLFFQYGNIATDRKLSTILKFRKYTVRNKPLSHLCNFFILPITTKSYLQKFKHFNGISFMNTVCQKTQRYSSSFLRWFSD